MGSDTLINCPFFIDALQIETLFGSEHGSDHYIICSIYPICPIQITVTGYFFAVASLVGEITDCEEAQTRGCAKAQFRRFGAPGRIQEGNDYERLRSTVLIIKKKGGPQ